MTDDLREFVHERFRRTDEKLDKVIELLDGLASAEFLERRWPDCASKFAHLRED